MSSGTEYLLSPFMWAHSIQNVVRERPAWRWASGLLSERSVPALLAYGVLDTVQRWTRGRTSNMRVIAAEGRESADGPYAGTRDPSTRYPCPVAVAVHAVLVL